MYIEIKTNTSPHESLTVKKAAETAGVSRVYITNKLGDDTLDHGYLHDHGEDDRGQKIVVKNQKWYNFLKTVKGNRIQASTSLWVPKVIARKDLGVDDGSLTGFILDGKLTYSRETNQIKKDEKYFALITYLENA